MRLIDADVLKEELCKQYRHFSQRIAISPVFEAIKKAPTVDAVEVVRCKYCILQNGCINSQYLGNDGYCSNGERK